MGQDYTTLQNLLITLINSDVICSLVTGPPWVTTTVIHQSHCQRQTTKYLYSKLPIQLSRVRQIFPYCFRLTT